MEPQTKVSAKNVFLNLGAIVALYTLVISLINLLFTIINAAYPQVVNGYSNYSSASISWPVATLIISFPILILLMWLLEKLYKTEPERQNTGIHKWLTYITLFISGLIVAGDLVTILYYFIDGQELTTGFVLKVITLFVITASIFIYYISDITGKLTHSFRNIWRILSLVIVAGSIIWGFTVLGSPRTQRLYKYDEQKVSDLQNLDNQIASYYANKRALPQSLSDISDFNYGIIPTDLQNGKSYEYAKTGSTTYSLCAEFNKDTKDVTQPNIYARPMGYQSWTHSAGHYCFAQTINPAMYPKPVPIIN